MAAKRRPGFYPKPPKKKATGRKRNRQVIIRLTDEELASLNEACEKSGKSRAQLLVDLMNGARFIPVQDPQFVADVRRLRYEVARYGNTLNQIAFQLNRAAKKNPDPRYVESLVKIDEVLDDASIAVNAIIDKFLEDN